MDEKARQGNSKVLANTFRPIGVTESGLVVLSEQPTVNSTLREDEWKEIDRVVQESARYPLIGVQDLKSRGFIKPIGSLGTLSVHWYKSSEVTRASTNMTGRGRGQQDLPDMTLDGVPLPITWKEFSIDQRFLEASRKLGNGIDTTGAAESARVVAEELEYMLFNGSSVKFGGQSIYGYTNHPSRVTDTAANFGGGDWGTVTNVVPTVAGMINAANGQRHYGPYVLYVSETQYNQAALTFFTDGTGETALQRLKKLESLAAVRQVPAASLADGALVLVHMSREVVEWAEAIDIEAREWMSPDGMETTFKVFSVGVPVLKDRYDGKSGIVHATGA